MSDNVKTILAFAAGTWRWPQVFGSPRYHLWTLAQRGWRVVYVEPPVKFRLAWKYHPPGVQQYAHDFHVVTPGMTPPFAPRAVPSDSIGNWWRAQTAKRMATGVKNILAQYDLKPDAIWYGAPWHGAIAEYFADVPSVFHVYDELAQSPALSTQQQKMLHGWEQELMRTADVTACSSLPQLEARRSVAKKTLLLENAIPDDFGDTVFEDPWVGLLPGSLSKLPRPLFIYGGVIDHRMEPALIKALLSNERIGSVSFIGNVDENADTELKELLRSHPKAHMYGRLSHENYPIMYEAANALILLHKRNAFTETMYPEKLNEYLSSGKPILSIPLPEVVRVAGQCEVPNAVRFVNSPAEMDGAIAACLADKDENLANARIALSKKHTWSAMGEVLDRALHEIL